MAATESDTIYAKASGVGRAGIAVYRLSGPAVKAVCEALIGGQVKPRKALLRKISDSMTGHTIDHGIVIFFNGPNSFTGEDVVEFHLHGGLGIENALYKALAAHKCRPADAGEFTKRGLINGKFDLTQIEGLADLLDAETEEQHRQAVEQHNGSISRKADLWKNALISALAPLESAIDFADEEDVPQEIQEVAKPIIEKLITDLRVHSQDAERAETLRSGLKVAIIGAPNAGKSSLLNALAVAEKAIVSEIPGTTRDIVEARINICGVPVTLFDTAGLRGESNDPIEVKGMGLARSKAQEAHLRILVVDPFTERSVPRETRLLLKPGDIVLLNKNDLGDVEKDSLWHHQDKDEFLVLSISVNKGDGLDQLLASLKRRTSDLAIPEADAPLTRDRHVRAVNAATDHLQTALRRIQGDAELAAEDLRLASRALSRITGDVDVEDILGEIFSSFCIGK
ncbi:MAG: tRNA uridine-5-carboxymethylaminomethyl(34) synthesis GTPase MnmE [Pseudomonadota bacterium]